MNALHFISFLIAFAVGFVAIKKFGISDKDILETIYGKKSEINSISDSMFHINESQEILIREIIGLSTIEIFLLILQELIKGVSNPIKISGSIEIPLLYLMKFFNRLVDQGLIDYENENLSLNNKVEINTRLKITEKGINVSEYFDSAETAIEGISESEFDGKRNL